MSDDESEFTDRINNMYQEERDALLLYFGGRRSESESESDRLESVALAKDYNNLNEESLESFTNATDSSRESYIYPGLNLLDDDLECCANNYESGIIHICSYYVNETGQNPFLQFILRKYDEKHETKKDLIAFPSFEYTRLFPIMDFCNHLVDVMHVAYKIKTGMYEYKGFINKGNQFYVFYDFSKCIINVHDLYRANDLWLVTMDEIMNHKKVCNFPICPKVSAFFSNKTNIDFSYLKESFTNVTDSSRSPSLSLRRPPYGGNIIETPIIGYIGTSSDKLNFISYFGFNKTVKDFLPNPHYYFTDYQKAIKMGGWPESFDNSEDSSRASISLQRPQNNENDGARLKGGVVRFALFIGHMKIFSEASLSGDDILEFDSVYIGDEEGHPVWALTKYEQQCPLTCHYINKSFLGKEWNTNDEYYII